MSAALGIAAVVLLVACTRSGRPAAGARRDAAALDPEGQGSGAWAGGPPLATDCPPEKASGAAKPGGVLKVHLEASPPHLNPLQDSLELVDRVTRGLVYESLLACGPGGYQPALAEAWEVSPDGIRLLVHLRPGVLWHDGRALTTLDVQASLESVLRGSSRLGATRATLADVAAAEVLPGRTLRLRLHRPSALVLPALCDVPIVPERLVRGSAADRARLARQPVGTGPFRFAGWERGRQIRLEAYPGAWRGPPALTGISFEIDEDGARALMRARRGEIDLLPRLSEAHYPDQIRAPVLGGRLRPLQMADARYTFVAINHRHPALAEAPIRRALARLLNRNRLAAELHKGLARPQGLAALAGAPAPAYDPALAARLLDEAGFRDADKDGVRERAGQPLAFSLLHADGGPAAAIAAQRLADQAIRLGIRIDLLPAAPPVIAERLQGGKFELALLEWHGRPGEDPRPLLARSGPFNHGGFDSARIQGLLDELTASTDPAARAGVLARLGAAAADEVPAIFLYRHQRVLLLGTNVKGVCSDGADLDLRGAFLQPPAASAAVAP